MYQTTRYCSAIDRTERPASAPNEGHIHAENRMELEALIERSKRRTQDLRQTGKRYNEDDPEERKRFRRSVKLAVYDAEHRQERYVGQLHQPRLRPGKPGRRQV